MKRIFAIALLTIHLFNTGGYLLLFQYVVYKSDRFTNEQISKGLYNPSELVEIKIPTLLPYVHEQREYEQVSGQVQLSGSNYNYVALRMTRDTIYIKCIPNYEKTRLLNENIITAKNVSDHPLSKKASGSFPKRSGVDNEYRYPVHLYEFTAFVSVIKQTADHSFAPIIHPSIATPGEPPEPSYSIS